MITILGIMGIMTVASAYTLAYYDLSNVGKYAHQIESLGSGTKKIHLSSNTGNDRVQYALNLSGAKKNIFGNITGYNYISGAQRWVSGGESTDAYFSEENAVKSNSFRATIVYNATLNGSSGNPVTGTFYVNN